MKNETYPYIKILFLVILLNSVFSIYFITLFLVGIVFNIFIDVLKKEYYYILFLTIFVFFCIETIQGISAFSLTIIAFFIYYIVIPQIKHIFSSNLIFRFLLVFVFYFIFFIYILFISHYDFSISYIFIINMLIDSFIVGFLI